MLNQELIKLEKAVEGIFGKSAGRRKTFYERWQDLVDRAATALENVWNAEPYRTGRQNAVNRQVRKHQVAITQLSDRLSVLSQNTGESDTAFTAALTQSLTTLEGLLSHLAVSFPTAFDRSFPVTIFANERRRETLKAMLNKMPATSAHEPSFLELLTVVKRAIGEKAGPGQLFRLNHDDWEVIFRFAGLAKHFSGEPQSDARSFFFRLYRDNFNAAEVGEWYQHTLLDKLSGLRDEHYDQQVIAEARKLLTTGVMPRLPFDSRRENLSDQLLNWLVLIRSQRLSAFLKPAGILTRLPLELSVAQLGFFARLCYLTGCFHDQNISAVLRFINQHFTSKKQNHISQKGLAKAFYSSDITTAASCLAWLQRMVDHINKKYFPK